MMTTLNNKEQKMSIKMHKDEHYEMLNTDDKTFDATSDVDNCTVGNRCLKMSVWLSNR